MGPKRTSLLRNKSLQGKSKNHQKPKTSVVWEYFVEVS